MSKTSDPATITLELDTETSRRIVEGYYRDQREFTRDRDKTFNQWLLGIILDWVEEVEKDVPTRDIGFGN